MSPSKFNYKESIELAKQNQKVHELNEIVYKATRSNDLASVIYSIELGANLHLLEGRSLLQYNNDENGLLHIATKNSNLKLLKYLLSLEDIKVDARNRQQQTPLHLAVYEGNLETINLLIVAGADIEARDSDEDTPVCWAAYMNHLKVLKFLLEKKGVRIDVQNKSRNSPLHWACYRGHTQIAEYLIERGVDYYLKNDAGQTPLMSAVENGHIDTVLYFIELEKQKAVEELKKGN